MLRDAILSSLAKAGVDQQEAKAWYVPGVRPQVVDLDDSDPERPDQFEGHATFYTIDATESHVLRQRI